MSDLVNPVEYGVLATGFSRMRFPEIRQMIIDSLQQKTGVIFETRIDSVTGQFIDVFAEREATMWELAEAVYHAMYPISATGVNLDHAVSFAGVRRLFAERSTAWCVLYGTETTTVSAGSIIRSNTTQDNFLLDDDVTISRQRAIDANVEVTTAVEGEQYWIQINSAIHSVTATAGDTSLTIAQTLYTQMLAENLELELDANFIRIYSIESVPFGLQISTNIRLDVIGTLGNFTAEVFGPVDVTAHTLDNIITTQTGWDAVDNIVAGHVGRNLETDDELRLRYDKGVFRLGAATLNAIQAGLQQNVPGIITVQVYENEEDVPDAEGRLAHSIEVIAYGGDPQDIADQIWLLKAAGIDTNGDITVQVEDSIGISHPISFNRPTPVYIWVDVEVSLYNEEIFPDNGVQLIQSIITETGNSFGIGKDVITQRLYGPIYAGVSGIGKMVITVAREDDPNTVPSLGEYLEDNIPIASRELSQFDITHVTVTINP